MSERAVPFYCPYCGEEDLRPTERTETVPGAAWLRLPTPIRLAPGTGRARSR